MPTMVANHNFTRVDTHELKDHIYQRIGHQRAEKYFNDLNKFLTLKLSKSDFDKRCKQMFGKENMWLHNKLILSIAKNACQAKTPPQKPRKIQGLNVRVTNGYQRNCIQSLYGDAFPQSPRKCRSPISRDRKFRDRPSPLGPLGKSPSITGEERTQEHQSGAEPQSVSLCSHPPAVLVEDGEEVEQLLGSEIVPRWKSVAAPIGIDPRTSHYHGYRFNSNNNNNVFAETCQSSFELPDTRTLMSCLEMRMESEGVGISYDAANALNSGLNAYLKRLIEPCIGLAGSRCTEESGLNGTKQITMTDFRAAMESNPRILGQNWAIQLEKICHYASEE